MYANLTSQTKETMRAHRILIVSIGKCERWRIVIIEMCCEMHLTKQIGQRDRPMIKQICKMLVIELG